jgi:hypothetical protein
MLSPMRASIVAVLISLLLAAGCGSGTDDQGADDGDRPADSSTSADTSPSTDEESESADGAPPTKPTAPPVSHNPNKPTVGQAKRAPADACSLLTAEDLAAAGFGRLAETPQSLPEVGCAAEAAGGKFEGLVYGVPPAEPGGKAPTGPMKVTAFEVDGNTAFWGFYAETRTCTAAVALGKGRWAAVHIAREDITQDRAGTIKVVKVLIQRMFKRLPNA